MATILEQPVISHSKSSNLLDKMPAPISPLAPPKSSDSDALVSALAKLMIFTGLAALAAQVAILPTPANLGCAGIAFLGTLALAFGILRAGVVQGHPISSFSVFAVCATTLWAPLIFTTLEWRAITFELQVPFQTFTWSLVLGLTLIFAHILYRRSTMLNTGGRALANFWQRLSFFDRPHTLTFWLMGVVGFVALYYTNVLRQQDLYTVGVEQGPLIKFINGFTPFAFAPFVLLALPYLQATRSKIPVSTLVGCGAYMGLILVVAVLSNARGYFAIPMLSVALAFILLGFVGKLRLSAGMRSLFVISIPIGIFGLAQLADLALAMRISREFRGKVDAQTIFQDTFATFMDKKYLAQYNHALISENVYGSTDWSENYVTSIFLSRFIATKFIDNTLALIPKMGEDGVDAMRHYTLARAVAVLPAPIYDRLGMGYRKEDAVGMSMGDFTFQLGTGSVISHFKAGALIGNGVAIMGYGFPLFMFFVSIPCFLFFDSLSIMQVLSAPSRASAPPGSGRRRFSFPDVSHSAVGLLAISPFVIIFIYDYFNFWTVESVSAIALVLVRGFLQKVCFYLAFVKFGRLLFG